MASRNRPAPEALKHGALVLLVGVPILFMTSIPWLRGLSDTAIYGLSAAAAFVVLAASVVLTVFGEQRMDEWHRQGGRFAYHWGGIAGGCLVALLLALPPFHDLIIAVGGLVQDQQAGAIDRMPAIIIFFFGMASVIIAQSIFSVLFTWVWRAWMSRPI